MDRFKNTIYLAVIIGVAAAIAVIVLLLMSGILAIAAIMAVSLMLVGGIMSLFRKNKNFRSKGETLTVSFIRLDETDIKTRSNRDR